MGGGNEDIKHKLNITVQYEGQQCTVLVRPTTQFKKIFDAAEKKFGRQPGTFKFTYDGERVLPEETPAVLDMDDGDIIDANLEQLGGA